MAMAASDISLLDSETAPLRLWVQELRPTPEDNLEIVLHKRWVPLPPGWGLAGRQGPDGSWLHVGGSQWPRSPRPGPWADRPTTQGGHRSVHREARVDEATQLGAGALRPWVVPALTLSTLERSWGSRRELGQCGGQRGGHKPDNYLPNADRRPRLPGQGPSQPVLPLPPSVLSWGGPVPPGHLPALRGYAECSLGPPGARLVPPCPRPRRLGSVT